jgi:ribosome biogenesis GTPase A
MDYISVARFVAAFLMERYPDPLRLRFKLDQLPETPVELVHAVGRKRGCLVAGGGIDEQRASEILLRELRSGSIARVSLETPVDIAKDEEIESRTVGETS